MENTYTKIVNVRECINYLTTYSYNAYTRPHNWPNILHNSNNMHVYIVECCRVHQTRVYRLFANKIHLHSTFNNITTNLLFAYAIACLK